MNHLNPTNEIDIRNSVNALASTGERIGSHQLMTTVGQEHIARYLFAAHWVTGKSVTDICCGLGYDANLLHAAGAKQVLGIDICPKTINTASVCYPNIQFQCLDARVRLNITQADIITCFEGLEHIDNVEMLLSNLVKHLQQNGVLFISTPNADEHVSGHSGNPYHVKEYGEREFVLLLKKYFGNIQLYFQWHYPDPWDQPMSFFFWLKSLLPVTLKRIFFPIKNGIEPKLNDLNSDASHVSTIYSFRPRVLPNSIRALPGHRYGHPRILIAVCHAPLTQ